MQTAEGARGHKPRILAEQPRDAVNLRDLCIEDLNLKGMQKRWGRKIADYGFAEFVKTLLNQLRRRLSFASSLPAACSNIARRSRVVSPCFFSCGTSKRIRPSCSMMRRLP